MEERIRRFKTESSQKAKRAGKREQSFKKSSSGPSLRYSDIKGCEFGKVLSPVSKRKAVSEVITKYKVSERRACGLIGQSRTSQRYEISKDLSKDYFRKKVLEVSLKSNRYGYRKIRSYLENEGLKRGFELVRRIRKEEGLQVSKRRKRRKRLWIKPYIGVRLKSEYKNQVWSYDFMSDRTHDKRSFRILNIMDEYTRECLCSYVSRRIKSEDVIFLLLELFLKRGLPKYIRSDNGPEFVSKKLVSYLEELRIKPLFISPGSPWENGYIESFNGKMRYEFLNGEIFYSLKEAQILIESWRREYNRVRPHSSLNGKPPIIAPLPIKNNLIDLNEIKM